jgi:four helix bundle protein
MEKSELKELTKAFSLRTLKLVRNLPPENPGMVIAKQLTRIGLSAGANCRSPCRARSRAVFLSKLGVVLEEADEGAYWLEIIIEDGMLPPGKGAALLKEANELTAFFFAATTSARAQKTPPKS